MLGKQELFCPDCGAEFYPEVLEKLKESATSIMQAQEKLTHENTQSPRRFNAPDAGAWQFSVEDS